ncbi:SPOR domain-containing protein [Pseudohaliea sp.]
MLKQRLVGALILLALGIVFWPIIFVAPEEARLREGVMAPPPPVVNRDPLPPPGDEGLRGSPPRKPLAAQPDVTLPDGNAPGGPSDAGAAAGEAAADPAPVPQPSTGEPYPTREQAPEIAAFDEDGLPVAWVLQVATVSRVEKARKLRDELIENGEKAFYEPLRRDGVTLYRVYVGPKFERGQLGPIKARVDARYGVQSLVSRYVP